MEFELDGGLNLSRILGLESKSMALDLHLGFCFDIRLKDNLWLNTGVLVKSSQGANQLTENVVLTFNPDFQDYVDSSSFNQSFGYFNIPLMTKYRFQNHFYVSGGVQFGIIINGNLNYKHVIDERTITSSGVHTVQFNSFDFSGVVGFGYKMMKGEGVNVGVKYYCGVADMTKFTVF